MGKAKSIEITFNQYFMLENIFQQDDKFLNEHLY